MNIDIVRIPDEEYSALLERLETEYKDTDRHFVIRDEEGGDE